MTKVKFQNFIETWPMKLFSLILSLNFIYISVIWFYLLHSIHNANVMVNVTCLGGLLTLPFSVLNLKISFRCAFVKIEDFQEVFFYGSESFKKKPVLCVLLLVRFCAAELELSFMRAQPLKPAKVLWRTLKEKLFSSNHMWGFFMDECWESWFYFLWKSGSMWMLLSLVYLECDRRWKVVSQCLLNSCRGYCRSQRKDKIIEIKINLIFLHIFMLLKNKSLCIFPFYSYMRNIQHILCLISCWLYSLQTNGTLLSNDLNVIISIHFHPIYGLFKSMN